MDELEVTAIYKFIKQLKKEVYKIKTWMGLKPVIMTFNQFGKLETESS